MPTYLLTWNPNEWSWPKAELLRAKRATQAGELSPDQWSTGNRRSGIGPGDRFFLLRQGAEPRGFVGSGWFTSEVWQGPHWNEDRQGDANYAYLEWDALVDDNPLELQEVESQIPSNKWSPQGGGVLIPDDRAEALERMWAAHLGRKKTSPRPARAKKVNAWLLLAAGESRQHRGNDGYEDDPAMTYRWDSTVANHSEVQPGDAIVLWDKKFLLGASVIETVTTGSASKTLSKCPDCGMAGIKARKNTTPKFKCFKCGAEFDKPATQRKTVTTYESQHDAGWVDLAGVLDAAQLRELCLSTKSQHSMRPLDWEAFSQAVSDAGHAIELGTLDAETVRLGGGHKTQTVRVRLGQPDFRRHLLTRYGSNCAFTGPAPLAVLEAGHLYSYAEIGEHHADGGLLLRRDIHRLFDLGYLAIQPKTGVIDASPAIHGYPEYLALHGTTIQVELNAPQRRWLQVHWQTHRPTKAS